MPASTSPRPHPNLLTELLLGVGLVALTLLVYSPCFDLPFLRFDDHLYVTENAHVRAGLNGEGVRWALANTQYFWHPLTWLSLELDTVLYGGLKAGGFHLTNVLLHALSTLLLFLVLGSMTGAIWRSALVAALFAVHPLNVESVAWVAERKGALSTLFWIITLAAYLAYVRRPGIGRYLLVVLAFVLGLMAKPMLVTVPVVLLLLDYWPLGRMFGVDVADARRASHGRWLVLEKLPLVAIALAATVVAYAAELEGKALPSFEKFPFSARAMNALLAYVAYLGRLVWPSQLAIHYPHPGAAVSVGGALASAALLVGITFLVLGPGRRLRYLAVGWLWYLATLIPVIGLVQIGTHGMADRYTYVPLIGLFLALTWGGADLARAWHLPRLLPFAASVALLAGCVVLTWAQLGHWKSDVRLWERAVAVSENDSIAHASLGTSLRDDGRPEEACHEYRKAIALDPEMKAAHLNLAAALVELRRLDEACVEFQTTIGLDPTLIEAHYGLSVVLHDLGRLEEAEAELRIVLALDPELVMAHYERAGVLWDLGQREEAREEFERAVKLAPGFAQAQSALGQALLELGRYGEAQLTLARLLETLPSGHPQRGLVAAQLQRCRRLAALASSLPAFVDGKAQPTDVSERLNLAWLCQRPHVRRYAAAVRFYRGAFEAQPALQQDQTAGYRYLAACAAALAGTGQGEDAGALSEHERRELRDEAFAWLRADLATRSPALVSNRPAIRDAGRRALQAWKRTPDLAGIRDRARLGRLEPGEHGQWESFWNDVDVRLSQLSATGR